MFLLCAKFLYIRFLYILRNVIDWASGLLLSFVWGSKSTTLPPIQSPYLLMPANEIASQIRRKQVTSETIVRVFIDRIQKVNPIINAVTDERFELALQEAKAVDSLIASGERSEEEIARDTPFLGVPISVKEHVIVKGLRATCGILARKDIIADADAQVVTLLKQSGAIILVVTNTPELCANWADCTNPVFGTTVNAYNNTRISGASSGGEGSILGAAGSVIGVGSDLAGSVRFPAMFNGVFGHKPTWDVVPKGGEIPNLEEPVNHFFTTGPMCRYASDLKPMLKVMAGENATKLHLDQEVAFKDLKFYYMEDVGGCPMVSPVSREIKQAQMKAIKYFEKKYGVVVQKVRISKLRRSFAIIINSIWNQKTIRIAEVAMDFKGEVNVYFELIKWILNRSPHSFSFIMLLVIDKFLPKPAASTVEDLHKCTDQLRDEFQRLLGDNGVFFYPTSPTTALYHSQSTVQFANLIYCGIFSVLGLPATHCTLGLSREGLPLGMQVVSSLYNDHLCCAVAEELERGFGGWVCPPSGIPRPIKL